MESDSSNKAEERTSPRPDSFFLTGLKPRTKEIDGSVPNSDAINGLYNELNSCVMSLDKKVGSVLRKHELEFLNEYKNRMYTIQKQMRALKEKANEEESRRRKAEKIAALEQERDSLRQKAEMLDKVCKEYKKGVEKWKNKSDALEDDRKFLEEQILAAKKQNSRLQDQLGMLQQSSEQAHVNALAPEPSIAEENVTHNSSVNEQILVASDQSELGKSIQSLVSQPRHAGSISPSKNDPNSRYFQQLQSRFKETINHLKSQLEAENKTLKNLRSAKTNYLLEKGELEDIFLQCVEETKKDILERKQKSARLQLKSSKINKSEDRSQIRYELSDVKLEHFKDMDKRKVIEMFLSQEKVMRFLYDRLFISEESSELPQSTRLIQGQISSSKRTPSGAQSHIFSQPYFNENSKNLYRPSTDPEEEG